MFEMLNRWYRRKFSDPAAVTLMFILLMGFAIIYFLGGLLAPILTAIVLAYLLEWPVSQLTKRKLPRGLAATIVLLAFLGLSLLAILVVVPIIWQQASTLVTELPTMIGEAQVYLSGLPERYPGLIQMEQIDNVVTTLRTHLLDMGQGIISMSLNSLVSLVALLVYAILVPLLLFFFLKDKEFLLKSIDRFLPTNRDLAYKVGHEMNGQIMNYIRGKVIEILIVGGASYITFVVMGLRYPALLGLLVGLSVLIPYIGATVVTIPVAMVALFQWGVSSEFWYLMLAYSIIQMLDGNVLVPVLFSEAVNLHPVAIIVAVLFFGGIWGFWGVFFAIPLATLVKAVVNVWPSHYVAKEQKDDSAVSA
ncbi:AI-2E family transporter [Corallincola holothuriorum]|uniref:AI-2E family transporter n=1 Tax=Corallincola holothuriorum TaxID=2282215 RepID=A0A368NJL6_9GAMM|nr:AI-2E family transporter [Corallincola holothuriorum]RCU50336.1 AI-2E family transporter [Corallincola holothuriorum]